MANLVEQAPTAHRKLPPLALPSPQGSFPSLARSDLYTALGVSPDATTAEIRAAYRAHARRLHPDSSPAPDRTAAFNALVLGARILQDPITRSLYDRGEIDEQGEMTAKGLIRRRRAAAWRAVVLYFLTPFAAGISGVSAFLWVQAQSAGSEGASAFRPVSSATVAAPVQAAETAAPGSPVLTPPVPVRAVRPPRQQTKPPAAVGKPSRTRLASARDPR